MKTIALGVSSSISIYKACEVLRGFQKKEVQVQVVMTRNAAGLIAPRLFSSLSGRAAAVELFGGEAADRVAHIALAEEISLLVVAPATANVIAKFASGIADDYLSTLYLAARCPVLVAPAMNAAMYLHPQTQANIRKLAAAGVEIVLPEKGYLACRDEGWGRLAAPETIVERGLALLERGESLKGKTFLITAGPTREPLDPVRFLSNRSSGKMGFAVAAEAHVRGARVVLVSGPTALFPPYGVETTTVETAAGMLNAIRKSFGPADVVIMAAAVADFRPAAAAAQKIKKRNAPRRVELAPTEDILAVLGREPSRKDKLIVGFAAETENLEVNARRKLEEKGLDLVVANDVSRAGVGVDAEDNQVVMIDRGGRAETTEVLSKREIARAILDKIEGLLAR
jgi:phosphopantothenoylcysteine decarboxylase / phosphopantothenate---cysteine ligase